MSFEEQLVNKINQFRANPKGYAKKINEYVQYFKGNTLRIPGTKRGIDTEEGAAAYIEAVDFLAKQEGIPSLEPSKGLGRICADFMEKAENMSPEEIGNIDLEEIIKKYGSFKGDLNRAIDFGGEDPEQVLINLIVCDGDPNRGNRESLLSTDLKKIGIKHTKHSTYRFCTLIISCSKFRNNVDSDDYGFIEKDNTGDAKEGEDASPEGVVSEDRTEKIVMEKGKKVRIIKIVRTKTDGSKETETIKEPVEEDK